MKAEDYGVKLMEEKFAQNKKQLLWYFLLSFSLIFLISFLILFFIKKEVSETKIEALKSQEQRVVKLENDFLGREFSMVLSDLHYLHHAYENKLIKSNNYAEIAENWAVFSNQRKIYDQIRFLDADGMEKIRVNISENGSYIVPDKDLQNKKERYYFTEAINLKEETVYVSPLDLNMEQGKVEIPFKPMIRLSTPVYDNDGKVRGIIVLNYLADYTLLGLRELAKNSQGEIFLLNSNGYSISSDNVENDWNFMFAEKKEQSFAGDFPGAWNAIATLDYPVCVASRAEPARDHICGQDADRFGRRPTIRRVASDLLAHWDHPGPRRRIQPDVAIGFLDVGYSGRGVRRPPPPRDWSEHVGWKSYD